MNFESKYEIVSAQVSVIGTDEILQVSAKVTEYLGIRHGENGEEIARTKERTISAAIPILDLPLITAAAKEYAMDAVKSVYMDIKRREAEAGVFVGYTEVDL